MSLFGRQASPAGSPVADRLRVVLARLAGDAPDAAVLHFAAEIAVLGNAHVAAAHVRAEPPSIAELAGTGPSSVQPGFGRSTAAASDMRAAAARRTFDEWRRAHDWPVASPDSEPSGVTVSFADLDGDEPAVLAERGRLSDLAIMSRPLDIRSLATLDGLISGTGRPVLMVPGVPGPSLSGAIVAWNGSVQSARALGAALPLLRALGGEVTVLSVAERHRVANPRDVVEYLRWHGIAASVANASSADVGVQLLTHARERNAGMIVSGAYSHGRVRQALFGGVTTYLVDHADRPVLFAS